MAIVTGVRGGRGSGTWPGKAADDAVELVDCHAEGADTDEARDGVLVGARAGVLKDCTCSVDGVPVRRKPGRVMCEGVSSTSRQKIEPDNEQYLERVKLKISQSLNGFGTSSRRCASASQDIEDSQDSKTSNISITHFLGRRRLYVSRSNKKQTPRVPASPIRKRRKHIIDYQTQKKSYITPQSHFIPSKHH